MSKILQRLKDKHPHIIESFEKDEDGYWIYLHEGYLFDGEVSFIHEDTAKEAREAFSRVIQVEPLSPLEKKLRKAIPDFPANLHLTDTRSK